MDNLEHLAQREWNLAFGETLTEERAKLLVSASRDIAAFNTTAGICFGTTDPFETMLHIISMVKHFRWQDQKP